MYSKQVFEEIVCSDTTQESYRWLQYLRNKLLIGPTFSRISRRQILIAKARNHLTYKKFTRIHILANVNEQTLHYEDLSHIDPANFLNFDESYRGKGKWKQSYCQAYIVQSKKNGCSLGKVSASGSFTLKKDYWLRRFERPITQHDICRLVRQYLLPLIQRGRSLPLFDNASIHTSQLVLRVIDRVEFVCL